MKFVWPEEFKAKKKSNHYEIRIDNRNPFWIWLSAVLFLIGSYLSYFSNPNWLALVFFALLRLGYEFSKFETLEIQSNGFKFDHKWCLFNFINKVFTTYERKTTGSLYVQGEYRNTFLRLETTDGKKLKVAEMLITEHQIALAHIINKFRKEDTVFIEHYFSPKTSS